MRSLLILALCSAALLATPPAARADDYDLPRHRPRMTEPEDFEDGAGSKSKNRRSHALPIESDDEGWDDDDETTIPALDAGAGGAERSWEPPVEPAPSHDGYGGDPVEEQGAREAPRDRRGDDGDWNDRGAPRRTLTAEEELRWEDERPRRLSGLDEPGNGVAAEVHLGSMFLDDATEGTRAEFAFGLSFTWQFGRLFAPENKLLHEGLSLEAAYLHPLATEYGTEAVQVASGQHHLWLAVLAGYPFKLLLLYGKIGPAMFVQPVAYDVQGTLTEWTGVKGGFVYGIGARKTIYFTHQVGIAVRVELTRYRRQYLNDTLLSGGVGVAF